MNKKEEIFKLLKEYYERSQKGATAETIANMLLVNRSNISGYLNTLCEEGKVRKIKSRPVYFLPVQENESVNGVSYDQLKRDSFSTLIGKSHSLKKAVQNAKAAILYPPHGLPTIIYGETGVGKSMMARMMRDFAVEVGAKKKGAPFITFNCADYANNPQLLMGHLFGVEKGAYTGADTTKKGLLEQADGGILFLDEIHRLPPEGQEILFTFMDKGIFRRMGQQAKEIHSNVLLIAATTENPKAALLDTFNRRIPMTIVLSPLRDRNLIERIELVKYFFKLEARKINKPIKLHKEIIKSLLLYECRNNVGQLQSDIKLATATSYLEYMKLGGNEVTIQADSLEESIRDLHADYRSKRFEVELLIPKNADYYLFYPSGKEDYLMFKEMESSIEENTITQLTVFEEELELTMLQEQFLVDQKLLSVCVKARELVKKELSITLSEKNFHALAIHIKSLLENNTLINNRVHSDINKIRQNHKEEFKLALKIIGLIEEEYDMLLSIESAGFIALLIARETLEDIADVKQQIDIIVAMHGEMTASSMVTTVKQILGSGSAIPFDMHLNKSYREVKEEFKQLIQKIETKQGVLYFSDMGSLNSFGDFITEELKVPVKSIHLVSTLMVVTALQKATLGLSLDEIYRSIIDMTSHSSHQNRQKENMIIITYHLNEGIDKQFRREMKNRLYSFINNIDLVYIPYEDEMALADTIKKFSNDNNVIAYIGNFPLEIEKVEFISREDIENYDGLDKLKELIKINNGYQDIVEGLRTSLKNINYNKTLNDVKNSIEYLLKSLRIKKKYDLFIGLMMHISFMIDGLVGKTREANTFSSEAFVDLQKPLSIVKEEMMQLGDKYDVIIDENECFAILSILYEEI
jgi:transcriptional regulator with AAA-type ATPase domain/transcriptional regulatory protein LevR